MAGPRGGGVEGGLRRWLAVWGLLRLSGVLWAAMGLAGVAWAQGSPDAVLRGELVDERGGAVVGAELRLVPAAGAGADVLPVVTGKHGEFGVLGVAPGEYVAAVRLRLAPVWMSLGRVSVASSAAGELRLRLVGGGVAFEKVDGVAVEPGPEFRGVPGQNTALSSPLRSSPDVASAGRSVGQGQDELVGAGWTAERVLAAGWDGTLAGSGLDQDSDEAEESASGRESREAGGAGGPGRLDGLAGAMEGGAEAERGLAGGGRGGAGVSGGLRLRGAFGGAATGHLRAMPRTFSAQAGSAGAAEGVASLGVPAGSRDGLHGSGFFRARESAWAAVNPFAVVTTYGAGGASAALARPADSDLTFGGAVGRAVRVPGLGERWRVGLFGSGEGRERRQVVFSSPETSGFYQMGAMQRALLGNRGVGSAATAAALRYLSGLSGPEVLRTTQWVGFGRVAVQPGLRDRMSVSYGARRIGSPVTGSAQVADGVTSRAVGSVGRSAITTDAGVVRWTHQFGPRWVNEVRGQVARDLEYEAPGDGSAGVPAVGPGGFAPQVSIAPEGFTYGTPASLGRVAYPDERRIGVADTALWRFGRHLVTVGGDWSRIDDKVLGATDLEGSFLYDSGTTGGHAGGLVDWISDYTFNVHAYPNGACPSVTASVHYFCFRSYAQSFASAEAEFETHEIAGFAEDSMRLGPGLRLSVGARWEYQLLPMPLLVNPVLDGALAGVGAVGGAPSAWGTTASFPEDRNNIGPRVAVSWAPGVGGGRDGRRGAWITIQAGYGMFFGRLPGATLNAALTETGMVQSVTRIRITPTVETACPQVTGQGFGYLCSFPYAPVGVAPVAQTSAVVVFAKRFRLPVVQRGTFAVERAVGGHVRLRAEYATAWATQLPQTTDLNVAPSTSTVSYVVQGGDRWPGLWTGQSFQVPLYTARRTTKFGPVTAVESNANATFHSGTAEAELRAWHGWGARGSFTFSRTIDYGPQVGPTPRQDGQFDPFADGYDKGTSSLDRPWQVAGAVSYRSRWERGGEWGRRLLAGWGMSALGRAGSGAPYSYVVFGGTRLAGGHESMNGSGGATYLPTVGRNTLRLPMRSVVDLRAGKDVAFGGRGSRQGVRVAVQADAFNLLNTVSLSRVETRAFLMGTAGSVGGMTPLVFQDAAAVANEGMTTPAFGTSLSSTTGVSRERTLNLGVRVSF